MSPRVRRILKIGGIAIMTFVLLVVGAAAVIFGPFLITRQPIVDGFEFNGIRFLQNLIVSIAVVPAGPNNVVLIDASTDTSGQAVLAELSRRNLGPDAVRAILLTHGHGDHMGAISVLPRAEVMALEAEAGAIERGAQGAPTKVTPRLQDGVLTKRHHRAGAVRAGS